MFYIYERESICTKENSLFGCRRGAHLRTSHVFWKLISIIFKHFLLFGINPRNVLLESAYRWAVSSIPIWQHQKGPRIIFSPNSLYIFTKLTFRDWFIITVKNKGLSAICSWLWVMYMLQPDLNLTWSSPETSSFWQALAAGPSQHHRRPNYSIQS